MKLEASDAQGNLLRGGLVITCLHADPTGPPGAQGAGGTHSYLREILALLAADPVHAALVTRRSSPSLPREQMLTERLHVHRLDLGPPEPIDYRQHMSGFHEVVVRELHRICEAIAVPPTLLHSVYWNSGAATREVARQRGIPYVHTVISNGMRRLLEGRQAEDSTRIDTEMRVFRDAAVIIAVSPQERRDLIELYGVSAERICVVGRPVASCFLQPSHAPDGRPKVHPLVPRNSAAFKASALLDTRSMSRCVPDSYPDSIVDRASPKCNTGHCWWDRVFLFVGRLEPDQKGVSTIIETWLDLYREHNDLCPPLWLIGGDGPEIDRARAAVGGDRVLRQAERASKLHWWGYLEPEGVSAVLLRSLALLVHSRYEPGGRVVIEAMTEGVPVIATPHGFGESLIRDWESGFLVHYRDAAALRRRMGHFVRQPLLRFVLGSKARKRAVAALQEWDFHGTHRRLYSELLRGGRAARRSSRLSTSAPTELARDRFQGWSTTEHIHPGLLARSGAEELAGLVDRLLKAPDVQLTERRDSRGDLSAWDVCTGHSSLLLVQMPSVVLLRPLWLRGWLGPLVLGSRERFTTAAWASRLARQDRIIASDEERAVVLLPGRPRVWGIRSREDLAGLALAIEMVRSSDPGPRPELVACIDTLASRKGHPRSADPCQQMADLAECLGTAQEPWCTLEPVHLSLAWRLLTSAMEVECPSALLGWAEKSNGDVANLVSFTDAESTEPVGFVHGRVLAIPPRVDDKGDWWLGPSDAVRPGRFGKDEADALLAFVAARERAEGIGPAWWDALDTLASTDDRRRLVTSWACHHLLERAIAFATIDRTDDLGSLLDRLDVGAEIARELA